MRNYNNRKNCINYLKDKDYFGSPVIINYKGNKGFGTVTGGLCSLFIQIFLTGFICLQVYSWLFKAQYRQETQIGFLPYEQDEMYMVPTSQFLPMFQIETGVYEELTGVPTTVNSEEYWVWDWWVYTNETWIEVEAVDCNQLIEQMTDLSEEEREYMLAEVPKSELCPDLTEFAIKGRILGSDTLSLSIYPTQAGLDAGVLKDTVVYTSQVTRYFDPNEYNDLGFQLPITLRHDFTQFSGGLFGHYEYLSIKKTFNEYYNFKWLDTTAINAWFFGQQFDNYGVDEVHYKQFDNEEDIWYMFYQEYFQSRKHNTNIWSVMSLDMVLGLVGGLAAIIFGALDLILGSYQSFRYENSLIGSIYPTNPNYDDSDSDDDDDAEDKKNALDKHKKEPPSEQAAKKTLLRTVAERGKYFYSYWEYVMSQALHCCCSCCCRKNAWYQRRVQRLERHREASEKLAAEVDIVKLIYIQRIGSFLAKLMLTKHQRALVTSFKQYQVKAIAKKPSRENLNPNQVVDECLSFLEQSQIKGLASIQNEITEEGQQQRAIDRQYLEGLTEEQKALLEEIADRFKPESSDADKTILYEVTGFQEDEMSSFWENYRDYEELGESRMVRDDHDEKYMQLKRKTIRKEDRKAFEAQRAQKDSNDQNLLPK